MLNMREMETQMKALAEVVRSHVSKAFSALSGRVDDLERTIESLPQPQDGKSVTLEDVRPMLVAEVEQAVSQIPAPKDGKDGADGKDGVPGAIGKDGLDGKDGESFTLEDAEKLLDSKMARWELDFERRAQAVLEKAIDRIPAPKDGADGSDGRDGADGKDGRDALDLDDLQFNYDGERTLTLTFARGDIEKRIEITLPVLIDRGVFSIDETYEKGDSVTWAGSIWIAQKDNPTGKPGEPGSDGWRLAVKRGRDGKDGRNGRDAPAPVKLEDK